ncbi:1D-myo-inositol 2-acetamido-2-deoxy-alpha-D-glucopyranoside deacetylase [Clostridium tepidiprofundi DSM 19306]|uniref:1D-myo-inositol 2-acetamido-2-deoxy-alpha-D-glucopyranoside deacetylase n=1 Tax=Clostridium tepidiprofundi DSM 19306 TaxID=1121338 RepID=A0A151AS54_9CLOT|nr:PIG-L family deacetylase [Clostridium tepidiprofundi]KYH30422.1 1D-myo-inositol 2-acetamido-2-deoxy-alpha-D-glucopyranoside deacetylase [Clostridium tepidiprofundi DSM 19306]
MTYLIVVAHPDDEVLGAGATMYKLVQKGHLVNVCILSGEVNARSSNKNCSSVFVRCLTPYKDWK